MALILKTLLKYRQEVIKNQKIKHAYTKNWNGYDLSYYNVVFLSNSINYVLYTCFIVHFVWYWLLRSTMTFDNISHYHCPKKKKGTLHYQIMKLNSNITQHHPMLSFFYPFYSSNSSSSTKCVISLNRRIQSIWTNRLYLYKPCLIHYP